MQKYVSCVCLFDIIGSYDTRVYKQKIEYITCETKQYIHIDI